MTLCNTVQPGDWPSVNRNFRKLGSSLLGPDSSPVFAGLTLTGLTASQLIQTDANKALASVADLSQWVIEGSANQVIVTDGGDGTVTLSLPQDYDTGATPTLGGGTFTGTVTGIDPVVSTDLATKNYIDNVVGTFIDFYLSDILEGVIATYYDMYDQPTGEAESTIVASGLDTGDDQLVAVHITESGQPGITTLRAGVYDAHFHAAKTAGTKPVTLYWTLSERTIGGSETLRMTSEETGLVIGSKVSYDAHATIASDVDINDTDRLVWKLYANVGATGNAVDVTLYMEGTNDSHITISTPSSVWQRQGDVLDDLNVLGANPFSGDPAKDFLVGTAAGALAWESGATARTSIGLGTGDSPTFDDLTLTGDIGGVNINLSGDLGCDDVTAQGTILCVDVQASGDITCSGIDASNTATFTGNVIISPTTQDYTFMIRSGTALAFQSQNDGSAFELGLYANDGNDDDNVHLFLVGKCDSAPSLTNAQMLRLEYVASVPEYRIRAHYTGTETAAYPIVVYTTGNDNQWRLQSDGDIMAVTLPAGATAAAAGAAANELWVTNGHATLPDGVVMRA